VRADRGRAVGGDPSRREAAILARVQPQRALALFFENEAVLDDAALASRPCRRVLVVDARADRIDRGQIVAMHRFYPEQDLAAVRIKPLPGIAEPARRLATIGRRSGPAGRASRDRVS